MLKPNLLDDIGFTKEMQDEYHVYERMLGGEVEECAHRFMRCNQRFDVVLQQLHALAGENVHEYTLDLLFVLLCTGYLYDDYQAQGICDEIFYDTMKDIKYKVVECQKYKKIFGTFVVGGFAGILKIQKIALGRLQYHTTDKLPEPVEVNGRTVTEKMFSVDCHIPSSGPLDEASVAASLKKAYTFFQPRIEGGIMPVICYCWLFYPPYKTVFEENAKNIAKFISLFHIYKIRPSNGFADAWRIFGMDYNTDVSKLPQETSLQRGFVQYIDSGGTFGSADGILFFDGEKIISYTEG